MKHISAGELAVRASKGKPSTAKSRLSRSEIMDQHLARAVPLARGRVPDSGIEADAFRRWFAPKFATFLRENFANPEQVAVAYGVRNSTAWNWWSGSNRASGDTVALTFLLFPQAVNWFLSEWEADR